MDYTDGDIQFASKEYAARLIKALLEHPATPESTDRRWRQPTATMQESIQLPVQDVPWVDLQQVQSRITHVLKDTLKTTVDDQVIPPQIDISHVEGDNYRLTVKTINLSGKLERHKDALGELADTVIERSERLRMLADIKAGLKQKTVPQEISEDEKKPCTQVLAANLLSDMLSFIDKQSSEIKTSPISKKSKKKRGAEKEDIFPKPFAIATDLAVDSRIDYPLLRKIITSQLTDKLSTEKDGKAYPFKLTISQDEQQKKDHNITIRISGYDAQKMAATHGDALREKLEPFLARTAALEQKTGAPIYLDPHPSSTVSEAHEITTNDQSKHVNKLQRGSNAAAESGVKIQLPPQSDVSDEGAHVAAAARRKRLSAFKFGNR